MYSVYICILYGTQRKHSTYIAHINTYLDTEKWTFYALGLAVVSYIVSLLRMNWINGLGTPVWRPKNESGEKQSGNNIPNQAPSTK